MSEHDHDGWEQYEMEAGHSMWYAPDGTPFLFEEIPGLVRRIRELEAEYAAVLAELAELQAQLDAIHEGRAM